MPAEVLASFAPASDPANAPICYVNGKRYELPLGRGESTLLQFLRGECCVCLRKVIGRRSFFCLCRARRPGIAQYRRRWQLVSDELYSIV